jgi:hypothetical protein
MSGGSGQVDWRHCGVPVHDRERGLLFRMAMIDERSNGWGFVSEARRADQPTICAANPDSPTHIVECGGSGDTRNASTFPGAACVPYATLTIDFDDAL